MEKYININELKSHEIIPGFIGRFMHTEKMTIAYWEIKMGSELPAHNHPNEQICQVTEGKLRLTIEGKHMDLQPGMVVVIPSGNTHSGKALTDCRVMDIFVPAREDYMVE